MKLNRFILGFASFVFVFMSTNSWASDSDGVYCAHKVSLTDGSLTTGYTKMPEVETERFKLFDSKKCMVTDKNGNNSFGVVWICSKGACKHRLRNDHSSSFKLNTHQNISDEGTSVR